jgi:hypothetical protein
MNHGQFNAALKLSAVDTKYIHLSAAVWYFEQSQYTKCLVSLTSANATKEEWETWFYKFIAEQELDVKSVIQNSDVELTSSLRS